MLVNDAANDVAFANSPIGGSSSNLKLTFKPSITSPVLEVTKA